MYLFTYCYTFISGVELNCITLTSNVLPAKLNVFNLVIYEVIDRAQCSVLGIEMS